MSRFAGILRALEQGGQLERAPDELVEVTGVADDSRRVTAGTLFCAVAGTAQDGHAYVADAAARGAAAALVTRSLPAELPQVLVRDGRAAASIAAREWYGWPADRLELTAVTGTNGKTTTVAILRHLLNADGRAGSIGTLGAFDAAGESLEGYGTLTTPGTVELQAVLADLRERGVERVVMEASSHALDQRRLDTLALRAAVYTNLTHEHLDYHPDLEAYRQAKLLLSAYLAPGGVEVVNRDDEAWRDLPERPGVRRVWWGRGADVEVAASEVRLAAAGAVFLLNLGDTVLPVRPPLLGDYNVSNALAAAGTAWALGVEPEVIAARLATAPQVPGRMERLADCGFVVLRDYAHTPDAMERVLQTLRPMAQGRLIVLFGAGGDRDRAKRPLMGRAVARGADLAVLTEDNPRSEDPERTIDDIEEGMEDAPRLRITDRRDAIHQVVADLRDGDCLLLAGKGHETYQIYGAERQPFDEREIVREALRARGIT
jgi:UDP-N-acetylmuramoyl-L-alanyl-D-glutamate--2,6-diaminopimelate ligase